MKTKRAVHSGTKERSRMTQPSDTPPPWPDLIAAMGQVREQVSQRLGHTLDAQHKEFLSYGNGWPEFYLGSALLDTEELGQGMAWAQINGELEAFYSSLEDPTVVPPREQMYPFSFDPGGSTIFAIWKDGPVTDGGCPVLWLPWSDTEPNDNFFEFFRMVYQEYEAELAEN
jgi:hypothetical protein